VHALRPLLIGGLFLTLLVAHDPLALAVPRPGLPVFVVSRPGLELIFPAHFPISFAHGEMTRSSPESSFYCPKMTPRPTGTAAGATSFDEQQNEETADDTPAIAVGS
jgi:hypothetical protein